MAGEPRNTPHSVIESIKAAPHTFNFLQAVRRLEALRPDKPPLGASLKVTDDVVRFAQNASLSFAPRTIDAIETTTLGNTRFAVNFLGMLGPNSPLPLHITEYAMQRVMHHGDQTLVRFLDVFNHRLVSLFYRVWAEHNQAASYDRHEEDRFAVYIGSLLGIGMDSFRNRDSIQDEAKLFYSGQLSSRSRHAEGLQSILSTYFKVPVEVVQFVGNWITLPEEYHCKLGASGMGNQLGITTVVGRRTYDRQQKFRIRIGPMDLEDYQRFLPHRQTFRRLVDWVRNYVGDELEWDVQLLLTAMEVPQTSLGKNGRLGWTTWSISRDREVTAGDLILRPEESVEFYKDFEVSEPDDEAS